ncbi:MAG: ethylbenzene dehydrogenase-related protein [Candidatus Magnetoovum sp. WYHC-5]|nr:ethylbenzene dehydrogenase-related protein [Candidatus Magnetoovum sp. WYHC-5]
MLKKTLLPFLVFLIIFPFIVEAKGIVILAKKMQGEIPLDSKDAKWEQIKPLSIPLTAQVMNIPRLYETSIKEIQVRAMHNQEEVAFLVQWKDDSQDASLDIDKFSDSVALEFPSSTDKEKPRFSMGDNENPVNIWYWKAALQTAATDEKLMPNKTYDANWKTSGYVTVDGFSPATHVNNPISSTMPSSFENIVARGFGTAANMDRAKTQSITGSGMWESGMWSVIFKRQLPAPDKLDVEFKEGTVSPISFAVWNGSVQNRGGKKELSTWYYVGIETETKIIAYILPVIVFALVGGLVYYLVLILRKRAIA